MFVCTITCPEHLRWIVWFNFCKHVIPEKYIAWLRSPCRNDSWWCLVICLKLISEYVVGLEWDSLRKLLVLKLWGSGSQPGMNFALQMSGNVSFSEHLHPQESTLPKWNYTVPYVKGNRWENLFLTSTSPTSSCLRGIHESTRIPLQMQNLIAGLSGPEILPLWQALSCCWCSGPGLWTTLWLARLWSCVRVRCRVF